MCCVRAAEHLHARAHIKCLCVFNMFCDVNASA